MKDILSILIPTKPGRESCLENLIKELQSQIDRGDYPIKIVKLWNNGCEKTIGEIRNNMIDDCDTKYLNFFDDDDKPSDNYISSLYNTLVGYPNIDAIGFIVDVFHAGNRLGNARISNEYADWETIANGPYKYHRTINHLAVVKTELAQKARFSDKHHGEDYDYACALKPLLRNCITIQDTLYFYMYEPKH